jgi:hypothetical protein
MSLKLVVFLAVVGGTGWLLTRNAPPIPPGTTASDSTALAHAGLSARFHYGVGAFGSKLLRPTVVGMVTDTHQALADMKTAIKNSKGPDGMRAQKYARRIIEMDSVAMYELEYGHPIRAARGAMEAKSLLNSVRQNLQ